MLDAEHAELRPGAGDGGVQLDAGDAELRLDGVEGVCGVVILVCGETLLEILLRVLLVDEFHLDGDGQAVEGRDFVGGDGGCGDLVRLYGSQDVEVTVLLYLLQLCELLVLVAHLLEEGAGERRVDLHGLVDNRFDCDGFHVGLDGGAAEGVDAAAFAEERGKGEGQYGKGLSHNPSSFILR